MSRIKNFRDFCSINESNESFDDSPYFVRHVGQSGSTYRDRVKNQWGLDPNPSILGKTRNFFQKMEDRINRAAEIGQRQVRQNRATRAHGGPDTGFEILFGAFSVVPNILKKIFGPTKYSFTKKRKSEEVDLELMKHLNQDFARNELPAIRTEEELADNIGEMYRKGGIQKGEVPVVDEIARNRAHIYYQKQANPYHPIFQ